MRTRLLIIAASLLAACSSGTRVVYVPVSTTPAPAPRPVPPPPPPPVTVTIARVEEQRLLVSTNQPAYVAAFEIVPGRGLTLMYPTTVRQRRQALIGANWLTVQRWSPSDDRATSNERYSRYDRRDRREVSDHHIYVLASDRPLRLTDDAYDDEYLRTIVGTRAYRDDEPYEAMTALARRFVPAGGDEEWGEDLYTLEPVRQTTTTTSITIHVARIYCPDGSVTYVREELANRAVCPYRGRQDGPSAPLPSRPDSVVASNGRPVDVPRGGPMVIPPIFRVPRPMQPAPTATDPVVEQQGRHGMPVDTARVTEKPNRGHDNGNGNNGNGNNGNGNNGNGNNGNNDDDKKGNNENHYGNDKKDGGNNGNHGNNGNDGNPGNHYGNEKKDTGNPGNNTGGDRGAQSTDDHNGKGQSDANKRGKGNGDEKPKEEAKGMRGVLDRFRENAKRAAADSAAADSSKAKAKTP